jgi:hypothetical protein
MSRKELDQRIEGAYSLARVYPGRRGYDYKGKFYAIVRPGKGRRVHFYWSHGKCLSRHALLVKLLMVEKQEQEAKEPKQLNLL